MPEIFPAYPRIISCAYLNAQDIMHYRRKLSMVVDDVIKAMQAVLAPEMNSLREKLDGNYRETLLRFDNLQRETNLRLDALNSRFDERLDNLQRETTLRFDGLNSRLDDLLQRLAIDRRLEMVERELDEKRKAS
jgi:hypothetical protein